jgi:hypothetical protein
MSNRDTATIQLCDENRRLRAALGRFAQAGQRLAERRHQFPPESHLYLWAGPEPFDRISAGDLYEASRLMEELDGRDRIAAT